MKRRYEKSIRILTDLMGYCHLLGADRMRTDIRMEKDYTRLTLEADIEGLKPEAFAEMERLLNLPRQREMEQNYWNISGEEDIDGEMMLAAIMLDKADVTYENGTLRIVATRNEE